MDNAFGKTSVVNVTVAARDHHTYIEDLYFTAPFKIAKPFAYGSAGIDVMMMSASAGLMRGDVMEVNITAKENTVLKLSSQSYEKIHKMEDGKASRTTTIKVGDHAFLFFSPLPTIPFAGSSFESNTVVELENKTSRLILSEIVTCGRASRGERFAFDHYDSKLDVYCGDDLLMHDILSLHPQEMDLNGFGYFEGDTHLANVCLFHCNLSSSMVADIRALLIQPHLHGGLTFLWDNSIAIRILSTNAQRLLDVINQIVSTVEAQCT